MPVILEEIEKHEETCKKLVTKAQKIQEY